MSIAEFAEYTPETPKAAWGRVTSHMERTVCASSVYIVRPGHFNTSFERSSNEDLSEQSEESDEPLEAYQGIQGYQFEHLHSMNNKLHDRICADSIGGSTPKLRSNHILIAQFNEYIIEACTLRTSCLKVYVLRLFWNSVCLKRIRNNNKLRFLNTSSCPCRFFFSRSRSVPERRAPLESVVLVSPFWVFSAHYNHWMKKTIACFD